MNPETGRRGPKAWGTTYVRSSGRRGQEVPIMLENIPLIAAAVALIGLIVAFVLYRQNDSIVIDNEKVADITEEIQKGAMAFLTSEYRYIGVFVVIVSVVLYAINGSDGGLETVVAFILGAAASVAAGFSGMRSATSANGRTAMAAKNGGQPAALAVSYNGGAVMGLSVGGLGLLGISIIAFWLGNADDGAASPATRCSTRPASDGCQQHRPLRRVRRWHLHQGRRRRRRPGRQGRGWSS